MIPSELNEHVPLPAGADGRHQPHLRDGRVRLMLGVWTYGIRQNGAQRLLQALRAAATSAMLPLNIIEEITKPISLALRLFGNIFAGGILLALIGSLTAWTIGAVPVGGVLSVFFGVVWKLLRHGDRRHPGLHLRPADRPLLRHGGRSRRATARSTTSTRRPTTTDTHSGSRTRTRGLSDPLDRTRGTPIAPATGAEPRRNSGSNTMNRPSRRRARSSAVAWPSPVARSAPASVTASPARPTSRAWRASPRPRAACRRSSS